METTFNLENLTLKDFEKNNNLPLKKRANLFYDFYLFNSQKQYSNYRISSKYGSSPQTTIINPYTGKEEEMICFVSNDYLGFTKHPKMIEASKKAIQKYGTGAGSSPLIGGQSVLHDKLEEKISKFFNKEAAITYTSGYASNSGTLLALLGSQDIAILDMGVHASVLEGCIMTNKKYFLHNDVVSLERILSQTKDLYRNTFIIIDGIYSQDGDIAPLKEIITLAKVYNAYIVLDDAHGVGVVGRTGKGVCELYNIFDEIDIITGTFSKTFASVGGFVVANQKIIMYLKFMASSNIFSAAATPQSVASVIKAIELLEEEPQWVQKIQSNINHFKKGLKSLNIDFGKSESAIFPIMIRNENRTKEMGKLLLKNGIYANPIMYPAVSRKQTRIRMSVLATHSTEMLDKTLNILNDVLQKTKDIN
ncbi:pyridoxal phosphate-dependent aminotransferase family protein [Paludibacter sp.]